MISFIRNLIEIDFDHQASNARHFKIVLFLITVVSYLVARSYDNIMICVTSLFIGSVFCFILFGISMPWTKSELEFKPVSETN